MKKILLAVVAVLSIGNAAAQSDFNRELGNHWGLGVGVGTEGINVSVATCLTNYVEMELGMNFMPGIKVTGDVDATYDYELHKVPTQIEDNIEVKGNFARTTVDFKAHVYPFGGNSKFFVAAGPHCRQSKPLACHGTVRQAQNVRRCASSVQDGRNRDRGMDGMS